MKHHLSLPAILLLVCGVALSQADVETTDYPSIKLRGYGNLGGKVSRLQIDGHRVSLLEITCSDPDKAKLTQAKYISDLQLLPGTKTGMLSVAEGAIPDYEIEGQGAILVAREDSTLNILAAPTSDLLVKFANKCFQGSTAKRSFIPEASVPMYLDRWDRFGFRIGCRPLEAPKGMTLQAYDKSKGFDWMAKMGGIGFESWNWTDSTDTAEGFVSDHFWDWGYRASKERGLSVEINLGATFYHGVQLWLTNRYPGETSQRMPGFVGSAYAPMDPEGGQGYISWNSSVGLDIQLAELQQTVRRYAREPNIVGWQEPHSELRHNAADMLREYGEGPDRSFQEWLRDRYQTVEEVGRRWRNDAGAFHSWDEIHVPELASFLGWGPDAFDLGGRWKVQYLDAITGKQMPTFPSEMLADSLDDSEWPEVSIPGDDHAMFLPKGRPAVFRRTFELPEAWLKAHSKAWLYLFDMNEAWGQNVVVKINGQDLGVSAIRHYDDHADWYDVSSLLKAGSNQVAIAVPSGYIAYRVYLSGAAPREYPNLGAGANAHWADYVDWMDDSRVKGIQRGVEMIRQADPDRDIYLASPSAGISGLTPLAQHYGCDFHDTGGMSSSWWDFLPSIMAGAGLPFSLEPGAGFKNLEDVKGCLGRWSTEGIQSVDYIQTVEEIYLPDDIRREFESHLNDWHLIGKYHVPEAEWATLYSSRVDNLKLFPWGKDPNLLLPSGHPRWEWLSDIYPHVGITDTQLLSDQANRYKVIIDSNTSIMDRELIDAIERYVRQGGIFVTYGQTGRHTSVLCDAWPISRLTGYKVVAFDPLDSHGIARKRGVHLVPGQSVFSSEGWSDAKAFSEANGLSLKKEASDCLDLMQWEDGTTAAGIRPLGKGFIVALGVKFADDKIWSGNRDATDRLFNDILRWAKLRREPAQLDSLSSVGGPIPEKPEFDVFHRPGDTIKFRHFVSNNGLYDVWAIWNMKNQPVAAALHFLDISPIGAVKVRTGESCPVDVRPDGSRELRFHLDAGETENFLTPRGEITEAPVRWFELQRAWWAGAAAAPNKQLPSIETIRKATVPLDGEWATKAIGDAEDPIALASPNLDDSNWEHREANLSFAPLPSPNDPPRHMIMRTRVKVPESWDNGEVSLWVQSWAHSAIWDKGRIFCDGQLIKSWTDGVSGESFNGLLKPGSSHLLAIEMRSTSNFLGIAGNIWLSYTPNPMKSLDLAGQWEKSDDALRFNRQEELPGVWKTWLARKAITLDSLPETQRVFLHIEASNVINGVVVNGRYIAGHPKPGEKLNLNITRALHVGKDNVLELVGDQRDLANGAGFVSKIALYFYPLESDGGAGL